MSWTIDSTRIFVQKLNDSDVNIIARLQPVAGGTILHNFGYEDEICKLNGFIVGLTDKAALKAMAKDSANHSLTTPWGDWGDYKVKNVSFELVNVVCQTLRSDLDANSPVFTCDLELYRYE